MTWRVMPAISAGSPRSRCWSPGLNQFQHFWALADCGCAGIGDEEAVLLGERVHPRAGGEVVGRLGAAVQHDDQRHRPRRDRCWGRRACSRGCRPRWRRSRSRNCAPSGSGSAGRAVAALVSPPRPCARPPWLIWSRKPRSASGICGIAAAVPGHRRASRPHRRRTRRRQRPAPTPRPSRDRRRRCAAGVRPAGAPRVARSGRRRCRPAPRRGTGAAAARWPRRAGLRG